jgi:hypothetical protein
MPAQLSHDTRPIWSIATIVATLLLFGAAATASEQSSPSDVASAGQPGSGKVTASPQVTVEARVLKSRVHSFVAKITEGSFASFDDPVQLWRRPICPLVAGLPREEGEYIFEHLTAVLTLVGATRGRTGCHPNFFVVATSEPESVLNGVWDHNPHAFGGASPTLVEQFIAKPRPVRLWYNTIPASAEGSPVTYTVGFSNLVGSQFDGIPTFYHDGNGLRQRFAVVRDMLAVVAIVDLTRVAGLDWAQVTDYIAMAGLANVDLDANVGDTPTILHLFATPADSAPKSLSDWDVALLQGLYHSDATSRHQRMAVTQQMVQDLMR